MITTVTAPSGVGKSTYEREFMRVVPTARFLVSTTTREGRATDIGPNHTIEYELVTEEQFTHLRDTKQFLKETFGDYGNRYGTRKSYFEDAYRWHNEIYLAAVFVPAAKLFADTAKEINGGSGIHHVYLDLTDEDERKKRLLARGETNPKRFEPELERWRTDAKNSGVPFLFLDATKKPEVLVRQTFEHFKIS